RAAGASWILLAISLLVYLPLPLFTWDWAFMQVFVIAAAALALPRRLAAIAVAGVLLGQTIVAVWEGIQDPLAGPGYIAVWALYFVTVPVMGGIALIGVGWRSEEHTSELQSLRHLVCRLL